jgi:predicted esterase
MRELLIATETHGRVLLREAENPSAIVIGFHGYMENADIQMERLTAITGAEPWMLISVQALNRFYKGSSQGVVASWMTRQDRDAAITDNIAYIDRVVEAVAPAGMPIVFAGFSQGVAMAFRAAVRGARKGAGVIAVGGDVPPELLADSSLALPPLLLARGERDEWHTAQKHDADVEAVRSRGVKVEALIYDGAHEWTDEVSRAAGDFISARLR